MKSNSSKKRNGMFGWMVRRVKNRPDCRMVLRWRLFKLLSLMALLVTVTVSLTFGFLLGKETGVKSVDRKASSPVIIKGEELYGIDINSRDNGVDYEDVVEGASFASDFVFIRASCGYRADPILDGAYACAKTKKRMTGIYFQYDPSAQLDARDYAIYCAGLVLPKQCLGKDPMALYLESDDGYSVGIEEISADWVRTWLATFHSLTGVRPLVYMSDEMARGTDWTSVIDGGYGLWVSYYGLDDGNNYGVPEGVGQWFHPRMHQFTKKGLDGKILGVDVFFGTESEWRELAQKDPI